MLERLIRFFLEQRLVTFLVFAAVVLVGLAVAPVDTGVGLLPRAPVAADAIPDLGENQQIVFTRWPGRSPQDVEDQVTYPLTVSLLGLPGVRTIRSYSYFGFSTIYVIFEEDVEFYWSRSRVLEKLNSLPPNTMPEGVAPALGPDATGLGQVFWYTLEGRDEDGNPTGGWDLDELRAAQDWFVRYALASTEGIAEVSSVGGYLREYQVEVDPEALAASGLHLADVHRAVARSSQEIGASVLEINSVEYFLRGLGWVEKVEDLEEAVVASADGVPVRVGDVAHVQLGPAPRRGALDKGGAEAVGGVVTTRYGENPLEAIRKLHEKIEDIAPGMPARVLDDGRVSKLTIVPFYDRAGLIEETLDTLDEAIRLEILVTILVVLALLLHLRASLLVSLTLPIAVLATFGMMKFGGVEANIVALSGIAIAIGTIVDMGIVVVENVLQRLREAPDGESRLESVSRGAREVGSAVFTAVMTTIVSFLPVFTMTGAEGKLFRPLAFTKTFALGGAVVVALFLLPALSLLVLRKPRDRGRSGKIVAVLAGLGLLILLAREWLPLGPGSGWFLNMLFVLLVVGGLLCLFLLVHRAYPHMLGWSLANRRKFLVLPGFVLVWGACAWLGFHQVFGFIPNTLAALGMSRQAVVTSAPWSALRHALPGLGKEFMPPLDEGSYLYMPTTPPHASIGEALRVLGDIDRAIESIPEVEYAVGKIGRAETALDPAPVSMVETIIQYKPEWSEDEDGNAVRNWRPEIEDLDDLWQAIVDAAALPGVTSAPKLQPIATRLVMLQSGMRAPMGLKVYGPDLATLDRFALELEGLLKEVPALEASSVFADRVVGKPYLEAEIDRVAAARYDLDLGEVHDVIELALGGRVVGQTIAGRERIPVRVRYQRELRDSIEAMEEVLVPTPGGGHVPLSQVAQVKYERGPMVIKTEDTFLTAYVIFGAVAGMAEVDAVEQAAAFLDEAVESGRLAVPAGVTWRFAGSYENQVRAQKTLSLVVPVALVIVFLLLYFHFRATIPALLVFSGVFVAWAGGFLMLWLYGDPDFLDFHLFGAHMREVFQISPRNLSVAVWVGFLALFGIATDDGVVMGTYLQQSFRERKPEDVAGVRAAVVAAGMRRVGPCLMTTATTLLALLPVLTSSGRGADVMIPMAIPAFGGMALAVLTMFVVPVLWCSIEERRLRRRS